MAATRGDLDGIQFGVLTDEQIRALAVVEVTESTLHTKGQPKAGGPIDTRFGTCSRFQLCGTCKNSVQTCPGHPGFIGLPYPLPHVAFIGYLTRFLNVFCFNCSHFLLPHDSIPSTARTAKTRLAFAYDEARKARSRKRNPLVCLNPECGLPQPTVYIEEPFVKLAWRDDVQQQFLQQEDVDDDTVAAPVNKSRKRKKADDADSAEVVTETPEQKAWRDQRQADYEFFVLRIFNNWDAYHVLRSIRKVDLAVLGIDGDKTHPSGFMLLSVIVPPMGVRPTVSFEEGSKRCGYNQLTKKIAEIVKMKRALLIDASDAKVALDEPGVELPETVKTAVQLLYVTISHYMIKDKCKVPGLKMSPYAARAHARAQSLSAALNGKKGRYRDTLMGKRVNFCLRTVVTTDPDADLDEIGLPEELARRLTVPIRVTRHNREALQQLMREDGVMQVLDEASGDMIAVTEHNRNTMVLLDGWVVERYVRNGDWIPINRQPTLHRPSIMGHRVRIHKDRTLKLPAPCTTPYNADHDGDEMNGHIPQTPEARVEVQELMAVSKHIMHPRANKPVMAIIQDGIDAAYFITHMDTFFDRGEASELIMAPRYNRDASRDLPLGHPDSLWTSPSLPPPAILKPQVLWTGKQLISCVLPRVNMVRKLKNRPKESEPDEHVHHDGVLMIQHGELLRGTLCKQSMGDAAGGIIHMACLYLGNNVAARFISDVQRLLNKFLISMGFSVGVKDCLTDPAVHGKVHAVMRAAEAHIEHIQTLARRMPNDPEVQNMAESQIGNTLKSLSSMIGNVVRANLDETNMFNIMANICGSKGSSFNLAQIMGMVGQTFVNGLRPVSSGTGRMLPSAPLPGQAPLTLREQLKTHGLIERPYKAGLSMPAAFLHNMGGREGLVDTAAKTSRTGYLQRRAVKAMESHHVGYDNTVRDAYQNIFQLCFGTDGLDTTRLCKVELGSIMFDNAQMQHRCIAADADAAEWPKLCTLRDEVRRCKETNFQRNLKQNLDVYLPFSLPTLIEMQRQMCRCASVATARDTFAAVDAMCGTLDTEMPAVFTCYHVRDELGSGRVQRFWRLCEGCVKAVCKRVLDMHRDARLQPGEGIGAMTATSIGEPCTQMTLNSVAWATPIRLFVQQPDKTISNQVIDIGEFIDNEMAARPDEIVRQNDHAEWIALKTPMKILSVNLERSWSYEIIEGVSRHPVVNSDGSETVLQVTTLAGRTVIATKGESFLRFVPCVSDVDLETQPLEIVTGANLCIGNFLPVTVESRILQRPTPVHSEQIVPPGNIQETMDMMEKRWASTGRPEAKPHYTFRVKGDMVVSIVELPCPPEGKNGTRQKMYDLTVANTRNFVLANGLAVRDTFHQAGAAKAGMTDGVPRMREIICASRTISTPFMTLPLKRAFAQDQHAAEMLARGLPFTLLRNILTSTDTIYEPDLMTSHVESDVQLVQQHWPFLEYVRERCSHWVIRFELCRNRTGARSLEPRGVADLIQEYLADMGLVIASRAEDKLWTIRVYMVGVERSVDLTLKKSLDGTQNRSRAARTSAPRSSITSRKRRKFADLSQLPQLEGEGDRLTPVPLHRIDPAIGKTIHTARDVIEWMFARNTQQDLKNELCVCGIQDIESAMVRRTDRTDIDPTTGAVTIVDEWVVDVKGSNFTQLAMLHAVDMAHMVSNHVMVIYETLGIDAAAHVLFQELQMVLMTSGSRVDDRLIKLLVDVMTHHGFVMPISRHGLNRLVEHGVLAKITFEETLEMLFEAAALGHFDPLLGVSENIMVGRQPAFGTNLSKMMIDRNGQRVPCVRTAREQGATAPDTRMITSVVTEHEETGIEETPDGMADWESSLNRVLITRNVDEAQGIAVGQGESTDQGLYKQLFYHGGQPTPLQQTAFRPSSPTLWDTEVVRHAAAFRPSSPVCE
jgi:DNA-directed RNA polymerase beta' subunit